jgi:branched-subunit amino acid transport protein
VAGPEGEGTPQELREGVRAGIVASLERDLAQRGGRTARRLLVAGAVGVLGAVGVTLLLWGHPYGHHPSWHGVLFGAVWTGLLVVAVSLVLLEVRTSALPLARSAELALLGLGLAGLCGALCPDQHFLHWWSATAPGGRLAGAAGLATSALCFGFVTALAFGAGAALLGAGAKRAPIPRPLLPAAMLVALLVPGVALQSIGTSWAVFWSWLAGCAAGAYAGVAGGIRLRRRGG